MNQILVIIEIVLFISNIEGIILKNKETTTEFMVDPYSVAPKGEFCIFYHLSQVKMFAD